MRDDERLRFEAYARANWAALQRTASLITGDVAAAEDVLQAAFVKLCASWHRVEKADRQDSYVRRVIINAAIDRARKLPTEARSDALPETVAPAVADPHERLDLRVFLAQLPPRQRAVVVLRFYADLSERQTAEALGISVGTVKSHTSRALAALRPRLITPTDPLEAAR